MLALASLTVLVLCFMASARQAHPQEHAQLPQPAPSLRSTTRLVQISVVVNDHSGNPITGLTKDDFDLRVDRKPQPIYLFSVETNLPSTPSAPPLPPNSYSNRLQQRATPANVTVIMLDELNTAFTDKIFARRQVSDFLTHIQPQDHVALYRLAATLSVLQDFSSDPSTLRAALDNLRGDPSRELANSQPEDPSLTTPNPSTPAGTTYDRQAFRAAFAQRAANDSSTDRVHATIAALLAIANHLRGLPGRKNLVWISSTFPFSLGYDRFDLNWENDTGASFGRDVESAARALTHANIAVYPVDARGLIGPDVGAVREGEAPEDAAKAQELAVPPPGEFDTMKILAARTGGRAFYNSNNLSGAIRHAIDDSRFTYTLGYYPADVKWDGSFHAINVKVNVPGARVRSRTGFFALPDPPETPQ
jgi:VWFA-related protein